VSDAPAESGSSRAGVVSDCGMAWWSRSRQVGREQNEEIVDMSRRLLDQRRLTVPYDCWRWASTSRTALASERASWFRLELALETPVRLWGAWPFFVRGWMSVVTPQLEQSTLIALGRVLSHTLTASSPRVPDRVSQAASAMT